MIGLLTTMVAAILSSDSEESRGRVHELRNRLGLRAPAPPASYARRFEWVGLRHGSSVMLATMQTVTAMGIDDFERGDALTPIVPWLAAQLAAVQRGQPDEMLHFMALVQSTMPYDMRGIADWYRATTPDLTGVTLVQAHQLSREWHHQLALRASMERRAQQDLLQGTETIFEWPDGWRVVVLRTRAAFTVEGDVMGHCIGSHDEYWSSYDRGEGIVTSLRGPDGVPHVTIFWESNFGQGSWYVVELQGTANTAPKIEYLARIREWLDTEPEEEAQTPDMSPEHLERHFHSGPKRFSSFLEMLQDYDPDPGILRAISFDEYKELYRLALHDMLEPSFGTETISPGLRYWIMENAATAAGTPELEHGHDIFYADEGALSLAFRALFPRSAVYYHKGEALTENRSPWPLKATQDCWAIPSVFFFLRFETRDGYLTSSSAQYGPGPDDVYAVLQINTHWYVFPDKLGTPDLTHLLTSVQDPAGAPPFGQLLGIVPRQDKKFRDYTIQRYKLPEKNGDWGAIQARMTRILSELPRSWFTGAFVGGVFIPIHESPADVLATMMAILSRHGRLHEPGADQ